MLPAHIIEREDRKRLDLIRYAMEQVGIDRRAWAVAYDQTELSGKDDCVCLFRQQDRWMVYYTERGTWNELGSFPNCYEASRFFWTVLCSSTSPYDYREAWEKDTGLVFSMQE
ncbi:MAG: hypothetical protein WAT93_13950 [Pontixanthobacter sp.]